MVFRPWEEWCYELSIYILLKTLYFSKIYVMNVNIEHTLNIMRKSSVVDMNILYSTGEVDTPVRVRIA